MDCIEAACEARILWKVISKSQLRVTSVTFIVHHCTLCPYDTFQAIYEMLETQFPRQDYQESRILFKDENGIFSEDSATKCAKQVLLASGTDLQGRNTRVRCHLWGVVRSGVKKNPVFPGSPLDALGATARLVSAWCLFMRLISPRVAVLCSCLFLFLVLFLSFFRLVTRKGISSKSGWLGLKPLKQIASQALVQATAFAVLLYGFFALLSRPMEKHMRYEMEKWCLNMVWYIV